MTFASCKDFLSLANPVSHTRRQKEYQPFVQTHFIKIQKTWFLQFTAMSEGGMLANVRAGNPLPSTLALFVYLKLFKYDKRHHKNLAGMATPDR